MPRSNMMYGVTVTEQAIRVSILIVDPVCEYWMLSAIN
jgi:hypothetical protein